MIGSYGWGLFVALPFCLGLFSVLLHSYHQPRSFSECIAVSVLPIFILGFVLLVVAAEGVICIAMAAPIALMLALLGGWLGFVIQGIHWGRNNRTAFLSVAILLTPSFFSVEHFVRPQPGVFVVKSSIEVNAAPEKVWQQVVAFSEIPPPQEKIFRSGIAYPIRAEIAGHGPGAVRHCVFSTGPFVEPITVWDEPHLLRFKVTANPAPLNELTPYKHIEPPHLHGYFESHQGQFLLTQLPNGHTRLEGTTWYSHSMWPEQYWHLWSDYIIHNIHLRVLRHIKVQTEADPVQAVAARVSESTR
ncbi:MAG: SRPBCC family protein [Acidobacteria bacterium]|nr:SRPBCC family protein [Acidobacteriota bacterium]